MESDAATAPAKPDAWPKLGAESRFALVVEASPTALVLAGRSGLRENRQARQSSGQRGLAHILHAIWIDV